MPIERGSALIDPGFEESSAVNCTMYVHSYIVLYNRRGDLLAKTMVCGIPSKSPNFLGLFNFDVVGIGWAS